MRSIFNSQDAIALGKQYGDEQEKRLMEIFKQIEEFGDKTYENAIRKRLKINPKARFIYLSLPLSVNRRLRKLNESDYDAIRDMVKKKMSKYGFSVEIDKQVSISIFSTYKFVLMYRWYI